MARYEKGTAFQGNPYVRKAGVGFAYTQDNLDEFEHCARDPEYFIENYVWIKNVDSEELVLFKLRGYQKEMVQKMLDNREFICKLPRQAGKTVCVSAVMTWHMLFNKNYSILLAAHKGDKARDIVASVKGMYEMLPAFLQVGVVEWNKGNVILESNSRVRASATSGSSARGDVYNLVYIDEAAFIATHISEAFFQSVLPTISSGKTTKMVITSTPKGLNHFYNMWKAAVEGKSGYAWTEVKWNDVPGRDEAFRTKVVSQFGEHYWRQEYGAEFIGSSYTLISATKLLALRGDEPVFQDDSIRVYAAPQPRRSYAIAADVAEGVLGDYSAAVVFDVTALPYEVACVYQCNDISTMAYPQVLFNLGKSYNDALVMVDATGIGDGVAGALFEDLEYEAVATTAPSGAMARAAMAAGLTPRSRFGLKIDKRVKATGCANLKALVEGDQLALRDDKLIYELKRFSLKGKGKSFEAEEGHDDLVMCCVIFAWMSDQGYLKDLASTDSRAAVLKRDASRIEEESLPVGMRWDGQHAEETGVMPAVDSLEAFDRLMRDDDSGKTADPWVMDVVNKHYPD